MHVKSGFGNVFKSNPFEFVGVDLMVPKQFALIVFLLSIAYKYLDSSSRFLDRIANYTLPIFFLHGFVLFAMSKMEILRFFSTTIFHRLFLFVVVMTICMSVAKLVRVVLGNKSKFLIGK
jgi:fucose 4-O-acetylase-like acetyltransferase